jgi:hypothetical protein
MTSALSVGTHLITASVTDSLGAVGGSSISVVINDIPTVSVTAPTNGTTEDTGTPVTFSGSASDPEDGDLTASLAWSSDLDGPLGTGASLTTSALSIGTHTITASATDGLGATGSSTLSLSVNGPPIVVITAPVAGSTSAEGTAVTLTGTATDEDGNLAANLAWSSSLDGAIGTGASLTTTSLTIGTHTITAAVNDSRGLPGSDQISLTVISSAPLVFETRITAPTDDAEETISGDVSLASGDLELVFDDEDQTIGLRFQGIPIPQGATISQAWVQFQVDSTTSTATSLTIRGQASDDPVTFSFSSGDLSSRPTTAAAVGWTPPAWLVKSEAGPDQQTPDLATVIQEIVDRPGWTADNSLVLLVTGTGQRIAESFDGKPSAAALLHVEYGVHGNQPPVADAGPDQTFTLPTTTAQLAGFVTDDGLPVPPGDLVATWTQKSGPPGVVFADPNDPATLASFPGTGTYSLRLTGDDSQLTASDDVTITILDPAVPAVFEASVTTSSDDAEEKPDGRVKLTSGDLEMTFDKGQDQLVGLRFQGVALPQGATITNAYVQFQVDEVTSVTTSLTLHGQAADDAPTFTSGNADLSSRPTTTAAVPWSPPAWAVLGASGLDQRTDDLSSVIQEVVSRPGWAAGNAIVLLLSGTGERVAEAYDGAASGAPMLHLEYTAP